MAARVRGRQSFWDHRAAQQDILHRVLSMHVGEASNMGTGVIEDSITVAIIQIKGFVGMGHMKNRAMNNGREV